MLPLQKVFTEVYKRRLCEYFVVQNFLTSLIFIPIISDYGNEYYAKENKNYTGLKIFKQKNKLNHSIYSVQT